MRSQIKDVILTLLLVATPTTWSEATAATSRVIRVRTGSSRRTLIKPNGGKPAKPDFKSRPILPPPKRHDFTKIPPGVRHKRGELLVRFAPRADGTQRSIGDKERIVRRLGGRILKHYRLVPGLVVVALPPGQTVRVALTIYNRTRGILYAEPNYIIRIPEMPGPKPAPRRRRPPKKPSVLRSHSPGLRLPHSTPFRNTPPLSALRSR